MSLIPVFIVTTGTGAWVMPCANFIAFQHVSERRSAFTLRDIISR